MQYKNLIKYNCAPQGTQRIEIYNENNQRLGTIKAPQSLITNKETPLYSFGAISDIHLQQNTAKEDFQKALTYFKDNENISFVCVCGDMTDHGYEEELNEYKSYIETYIDKPVYSIMGNHDTQNYSGIIGIENNIQEYTGYPLYYSFEAGNNDLFIMLGNYREVSVLSEEELDWFEQILNDNQDKRCFVFQHTIFGYGKIEGCGNAFGLYNNQAWNGYEDREQRFKDLLVSHSNLIFFHGHSHISFSIQSKKCEYANIDNSNGYWSVHIPSLSIPRNNIDIDQELERCFSESEGYVINVYDNYIILKGRDFVKDKFLPIANYKLNT